MQTSCARCSGRCVGSFLLFASIILLFAHLFFCLLVYSFYRKVVFPRITALDKAEGARGGAAPFDEQNPLVQAWLASERKADLAARRKQKASGGASLPRTLIAHFVTMASGLIGVAPSTLQGNAVLKEYFFDAKNVLHPYPSRDEIDAMCASTGISHSTVKNWFGNTRKVRRR